MFQLLCAFPQALGTRRLWIRATALSNQAVCVTSHPCHLALSTEKGSVPFLVSGIRGHVWGQVYYLAEGEQIPERRGGLNAQCPRGPSSLGNSFPSFLAPPPQRHGSLARLQRNAAGLLNTKCSCQSPGANLCSLVL